MTDIGRVLTVRKMGKIAFVDVVWDFGHKQQLVFKGFAKEDLPKVASIISYEGEPYVTQTGEPSILVENFNTIRLSEELLQITRVDQENVAHGAIEDKELKYRSRYIDLITNPTSVKLALERSEYLHSVRNLMYYQGFKEVETPILQPEYGGAEARPFTTVYSALGDQEMFLRISPELYLKRCIVGGMPKVFEIGKVFRNEGIDSTHSPEFTMLEAYATGYTLEKMLDLCLKLVAKFGKDYTTIDWAPNLDESSFDPITVVVNHPMEDSPLAKENPNKPGFAERFELYLDGVEVANAYCEQDDPDKLVGKVDDDFIRALRIGMPPTVGLGIGIDRIVMHKLGVSNIRDIILFPTLRKQK